MAIHRCRRCGADGEAPADGLPLAWSLASGPDGDVRLCATCTRDHARDIEAKLDESWWS